MVPPQSLRRTWLSLSRSLLQSVLLWPLLLFFDDGSNNSYHVMAWKNNNIINNSHPHGGGINMGTTIVAVQCQDGVIVGADTRTSTGVMVSNRFAEKLSLLYQQGPVSCVLCRSGSAADTQFLADQARWVFQERCTHDQIPPTVSQMAQWLQCVIRSRPYMASLLCVGYDPTSGNNNSNNGGQIYSISQSGAMMEEPLYAAAGSGSTYILGLMDNALRNKEGLMEEQEAIDFVARLIHVAMARDGGSGGMARITVMNQDGLREIVVPPPGEGAKEKPTEALQLKGFQPATRGGHNTAFVK